MKKILILLLALAFSAGCKTVNESVPTTDLGNEVRLPAHVLTAQAKLKTINELVAAGVIESPEQLEQVLKHLRRVDGPLLERILRRKLAIAEMTYRSPKDLSADVLKTTYDPETGAFVFDATNLDARTSPEIVIATGDAQAKITAAEGEAVSAFNDSLGGVVKKTAALAKELKSPPVPGLPSIEPNEFPIPPTEKEESP